MNCRQTIYNYCAYIVDLWLDNQFTRSGAEDRSHPQAEWLIGLDWLDGSETFEWLTTNLIADYDTTDEPDE